MWAVHVATLRRVQYGNREQKKGNDSAAEKTDKHSQSGKQGQYQLVNHVNSIYP